MQLGPSFLLLQQEGYLIRTSLAQGLTMLRNAHIGEKGYYYAGFFGLSIGLERLMKVIVVLDYMAKNRLVALNGPALKRYGGRSGHDLGALLASCRTIDAPSPHPLEALGQNGIEHKIIEQLSDFAEACGRYANLDALASSRPILDPLTRGRAS